MGRRQLFFLALSFLHLPMCSRAEIITTQDWSGSFAINYQRNTNDSETIAVKKQIIADINGKYYLWQPWFVTGKLRLNFTGDRTRDTRSTRERSSLGGNITAKILPLSRYPMSLGYSKVNNAISDSDSFVNATGQSINLGDSLTSTSYFITQQYLGKRFKLTAVYHYDENEDDFSGRHSSAIRKIDLIRRAPHSDINLSVQQREDIQHQDSEQRDSQVAVLTHNYYPSQDFNISNFASSIEQIEQRDLDGDGTIDNYHNNIDQASSLITWRSSDKKTHIIGNMRYTGIQTEQSAGSGYENISGNAGLSMRYRLTDNITTSASVARSNIKLNNTTSYQSNNSVIVRYNSDTIEIGDTRYNWGASATDTWSKVDDTSEETQTLSLDHTLSHNWLVGRKGRINLGVNQSISQQESSVQEEKAILTQGVRLGFNRAANGLTQYAQSSYSESRNTHGPDERSSQGNIQLSQQQQLNTRSSINTSLTYQQSRFQSSTQDTNSASTSLLLNYATRRDFMFQTLSFNSSARYSKLQSSISPESDRYTWDNVLKHQIGMLSSSATLRTQEIDKIRSSLLLINIKRRF